MSLVTTSRRAWFAHPLGYRVPLDHISSLDRWLEFLLSTKKSIGKNFVFLSSQVAFLLWQIWKHRCKCVFEHGDPDPIGVASSAYQAASEYLAAQVGTPRAPSLVNVSESSLWCPPLPGHFKINTDASWNSSSLSCGLAAILRNDCGALVNGFSLFGSACSAEAAEAQAVLLGLKLAVASSLSSFSLEADCLSLISALSSPRVAVDWTTFPLLCLIRSQSASFSSINWCWTSREANSAADLVASMASRKKCPVDWVLNPPASLLHVLSSDAVSAPP